MLSMEGRGKGVRGEEGGVSHGTGRVDTYHDTNGETEDLL